MTAIIRLELQNKIDNYGRVFVCVGDYRCEVLCVCVSVRGLRCKSHHHIALGRERGLKQIATWAKMNF